MHGDEGGEGERCGSAVGEGCYGWERHNSIRSSINQGNWSYSELPAKGGESVPHVTAPLGEVLRERGYEVLEQLPCRLAFGPVDNSHVTPFVVHKELGLNLFLVVTKVPGGSKQSNLGGVLRILLGG